MFQIRIALGSLRTILAGFALSAVCVVAGCKHGEVKPAPLAPVTDPPVTVRGGSVTVRYSTAWNCPVGQTYCSINLGKPAVLNALDGVEPIPSNGDPGDGDITPQTVSESVSTNWKVKLTFRQSNEKSEDRDTFLLLCTSDSACSSTSGPVGDTLYLVGGSNGSLIPIMRDRPGVRYDLTACGGVPVPGDSKCNHVHTARVFANGVTPAPRYHCIDGECTITVGQ
jgi:hypothetical protein